MIFQTCLMQNSKLFQMIFIPIHLVKYSLSYGDSKTPLIFSFQNSVNTGWLWKLIFENVKIFPFFIFQTCLMQNSKLFQMIFIPIHLVKYSLSYGDSKTPLIFSFENSRKTGSLWKLIFENVENISIFDFPDLSDAEFQALSDDLYPNSFGEIFIELWWFKDTTDFQFWKFTKNRFTLKVDFWKCRKYFHFWFSRPVWCRIPSSFRWSLSQFIWWNIHWVMVIQRHHWFSVLKIHEKQVHFESWFLKM